MIGEYNLEQEIDRLIGLKQTQETTNCFAQGVDMSTQPFSWSMILGGGLSKGLGPSGMDLYNVICLNYGGIVDWMRKW